MDSWPSGYRLTEGSSLDRVRLTTTMKRAYADAGAIHLEHLAHTVEQYLSASSTLWWLERDAVQSERVGFRVIDTPEPLGCLWLGHSTNQLTGAPQVYVYLVYVAPAHRRRGLGRRLMEHAQKWAINQGYGQVSLQTFTDNAAALGLYQCLGYTPRATWLTLDL